MEKVNNLDVYVNRMEKSLLDKLFFMDKVFEPIDTVLDFGCANGVLIKMMQMLFPEYAYVGYDISEEMIDRARKTLKGPRFYTDWDAIDCVPEKTLINISSTLHEVYHYGTSESIEQFWDRVFQSGFRYIAIRDMMLSDSIKLMSDEQDVVKARGLYPQKLTDYESVWGPVSIRFYLIHYLLKYRYTENWDREVRENYFPLTKETLLAKIPSHYEIVYQEHYTLPYIKHQVQKDCGIVLNDCTHFKILLKSTK